MDRILGPIRRNQYGLAPPDFESSEQTVTFDTTLDVAHGLIIRPTLFAVVLRCLSTEHGWAAGDEIIRGHNEGDFGETIGADATNVTIDQGQSINVHVQSTHNSVAVTVGNWKWVVRAWL